MLTLTRFLSWRYLRRHTLRIALAMLSIDWIERTIRANLFVSSGSTITTGGGHTLMNQALGDELARHPRVADVMPARLAPLDFGQTQVRVCSLPMDIYTKHNTSTLTRGDDDPLPKLLDPAGRCKPPRMKKTPRRPERGVKCLFDLRASGYSSSAMLRT